MNQMDAQALADRRTARFGLAHVEIREQGFRPQTCGNYAGFIRVNLNGEDAAVRNVILHHISHMVHAASGQGGNLHGHEWRNFAKRCGAEQKALIGQGGKRVRQHAIVAAPQVAPRIQIRHIENPAIAQVAPVVNENPTTYTEWKTFIQVKGLRQLGQGISRTAYALDENRVIKIQTAGPGGHGFLGQCASEVARWNNADPELRQYLAAILDSGDGWCIMERAVCTLRDFGGETHRVSHDLTTATRIGDLHAKNIGYFTGGRFKIIDYAL